MYDLKGDKQMKRVLVLILASLMVLVLFAGCNKDSGTTTTSTPRLQKALPRPHPRLLKQRRSLRPITLRRESMKPTRTDYQSLRTSMNSRYPLPTRFFLSGPPAIRRNGFPPIRSSARCPARFSSRKRQAYISSM
jgi:hypothetical protein